MLKYSSRSGFQVLAAIGCLVFVSALFSGCVLVDVAGEAVGMVGSSGPKGGDSFGKRVVVVPFDSGIKKLQPLAQDLGAHLSSRLAKDKEYLQLSFKEFSFQVEKASKKVGIKQALLAAGRRLGVNALLTGTITDMSVDYRFEGFMYGFRENTPFLFLEARVRLTDPVTGVVVSESTLKEEIEISDLDAENMRLGKDPDPKKVASLQDAIKSSAMSWFNDALSDVSWSGTVLDVRSGQALVTVGKDTGFSRGDTLQVLAVGETLKAGAGQTFYVPGDAIATLTLVEIGERNSWATIQMMETGEEKKGDKKDNAKKAKPPVVKPGLIVRAD
jgi:hypothetical protein